MLAVFSLLPEPFVSLFPGDFLLRLTLPEKSSSLSGELAGDLLAEDGLDLSLEEEEASGPKELVANSVPFLGGRPIRFPDADILGPGFFTGPTCPPSSSGLLFGEIMGKLLCLLLSVGVTSGEGRSVLILVGLVSILSGFPN